MNPIARLKSARLALLLVAGLFAPVAAQPVAEPAQPPQPQPAQPAQPDEADRVTWTEDVSSLLRPVRMELPPWLGSKPLAPMVECFPEEDPWTHSWSVDEIEDMLTRIADGDTSFGMAWVQTSRVVLSAHPVLKKQIQLRLNECRQLIESRMTLTLVPLTMTADAWANLRQQTRDAQSIEPAAWAQWLQKQSKGSVTVGVARQSSAFCGERLALSRTQAKSITAGLNYNVASHSAVPAPISGSILEGFTATWRGTVLREDGMAYIELDTRSAKTNAVTQASLTDGIALDLPNQTVDAWRGTLTMKPGTVYVVGTGAAQGTGWVDGFAVSISIDAKRKGVIDGLPTQQFDHAFIDALIPPVRTLSVRLLNPIEPALNSELEYRRLEPQELLSTLLPDLAEEMVEGSSIVQNGAGYLEVTASANVRRALQNALAEVRRSSVALVTTDVVVVRTPADLLGPGATLESVTKALGGKFAESVVLDTTVHHRVGGCETVWHARERAYVAGYEGIVAENSAVLCPQVATLCDGLSLGIGATPTGADAWTVRVCGQFASAANDLPQGKFEFNSTKRTGGPLQKPEVATVEVNESITTAANRWVLVPIEDPATKDTLAMFVRIRPIQ